MLPDAKIHLLLAQQLPEFRDAEKAGALSKTIAAFSAYTRRMITSGRLPETRKCLSLAGVLYKNGSRLLQDTIESVYLFGISPFLDSPVKALLPASLCKARQQLILNNSQC